MGTIIATLCSARSIAARPNGGNASLWTAPSLVRSDAYPTNKPFRYGDLPIVFTGLPLLKSEITQRWVIIGTAAKRPAVSALTLLDREIVDAGNAQAH
jgi:hypothetical protein